MAATLNLEKYFERIGYWGSPKVNLDTLTELSARQSETLPFENLDPLMWRRVCIDVQSLEAKMVAGGRGGYCYELNLLLKLALERIGFRVTGLLARLVPENRGEPTARTHMLLHVELDGIAYVCDVGFGASTLTGPIRFELNTVQHTPHDRRRITRVDGRNYLMSVAVRERWHDLYTFDLEPQHLPDFEVSNWYDSAYPESHFRHRLIAARPTARGRYTLRNNLLSDYDLQGNARRTTLTTVEEICSALAEQFLIRLPLGADLTAALTRVLSAPLPGAGGETEQLE